jgi:hypothetical protein
MRMTFDASRVHRIVFYDVDNYQTLHEYADTLEYAGARIDDFVIDYKRQAVRFHFSLNREWSKFLERLQGTKYWDRTDYSELSGKGVATEL